MFLKNLIAGSFYSGVGSRKTPLHILYVLSLLSYVFERNGLKLRSGGALGADTAFLDALLYPESNSQIFVTNKSIKPHYYNPKELYGLSFDGLYRQAMRLIMDNRLHKNWESCSSVALDLHNRNVFQVLGVDLETPSQFVLCWTGRGESDFSETTQLTGGTGTAINTASFYGIPVFNLGDPSVLVEAIAFIEQNIDVIDFQFINSIVPYSRVVKRESYFSQLGAIKRDLSAALNDCGCNLSDKMIRVLSL